MGCWNETCYITNLPIFSGDPIVVIPLMKIREGRENPHPCEVADNYMPIAFPIFGKYNDYGGIEDATTSSENANHIYSMVFFTKNYERDDYEPVLVESCLDDFVNQVFCSPNTVYVEVKNNYFFPDGKAPVTFMMMHREIYMQVLQEVGGRFPYQRNMDLLSTLKKYYRNKYDAIIQHDLFPLHKCDSVALKEEELDKFRIINRINRIRQMSDEIFAHAFCFHKTIWNDMSECIIDNPNCVDSIICDVANLTVFAKALSYMRKGFLTNIGRGSQDCETRLHVIVSKFVCEHVREYAEEAESADVDGIAEAVYFYD